MQTNTSRSNGIRLKEADIYQAVFNYLDRNYIFKKLEIEQWLGLNQILYIRKEEQLAEIFNGTLSAEELWHEGHLEDWFTYSAMSLNSFYDDFLWRNMATTGFKRKTLVKKMIAAVIEKNGIATTLKFNPKLKQVIALGRQKVTGTKPLSYTSTKRQHVELAEGEFCYLNWYAKSPYIANPAIVYKKHEGSYRLLFFTNMKNGAETSTLNINTARFLTVPADELGKTAMQAVLQRFC